jgi:hypothetical protein
MKCDSGLLRNGFLESTEQHAYNEEPAALAHHNNVDRVFGVQSARKHGQQGYYPKNQAIDPDSAR